MCPTLFKFTVESILWDQEYSYPLYHFVDFTFVTVPNQWHIGPKETDWHSREDRGDHAMVTGYLSDTLTSCFWKCFLFGLHNSFDRFWLKMDLSFEEQGFQELSVLRLVFVAFQDIYQWLFS